LRGRENSQTKKGKKEENDAETQVMTVASCTERKARKKNPRERYTTSADIYTGFDGK